MIIANNVTKVYNKKRKSGEKRAVQNISFTINDGDIIGYIGLNGAGKSTMIKMLCGILQPTEGEILINNLNPFTKRKENAKQIGVVFGQRTQLWWDLPLIDSYKLLKKVYNISNEDFEKKLAYYDKVFDISKHLNSLVRTLSLGERMKADIIASMLHSPKILFLDEPTIGLDFIAKRRMYESIKELHKKYNTTIFLTSHDMDDINQLCNRVMIVDKGIKIYDNHISSMKNTFQNIKIIDFVFRSNQELTNVKSKIKDTFKNLNIEFTVDEDKCSIMYDCNEIKSYTIIEIISSIIDTNSVVLKELPIENIIERIYNHENQVTKVKK